MISSDQIPDDPQVAAVAAALEALAADSPEDLPAQALRERLVAVHRLAARVESVLLGVVGSYDVRAAWATDGARSARRWLTARVDQGWAAAGRDLDLARDLQAMPAVAEAMATGVLGRAKAELLAAARTPEVAAVFADQEEALVGEVTGLDVADTRRFLRAWLELARQHVGWTDPEGPDPDRAPQAALHLSTTFEGRWELRGELDTENGTVLDALIATEVRRMRDAGQHCVPEGEPPLSPAVQRGLALMQIALRGADPSRAVTTVRADLAVMIDADTLSHRPLDHPTDTLERVCELNDRPVHRSTAERLLCNAEVHRLVVDAVGEVVDVGRAERLATRAQRRAARAKHGGCAFPGCDAPWRYCDMHHLHPWDDGGSTDHANLTSCQGACK